MVRDRRGNASEQNMKRGRLFGAALMAALCPVLLRASWARELTFDDRVKAQRAIEEVYWSHRIWPKENTNPKPVFEQAMPEEVIHAKVADYLKKGNALARLWARPVTPAQLQAEINRMSRRTHSP